MTDLQRAKLQRHSEVCDQAVRLVDFYRGIILDSVEAGVDAEEWGRLRPRLLKALGDRGLQGRLIELLDAYAENHPK